MLYEVLSLCVNVRPKLMTHSTGLLQRNWVFITNYDFLIPIYLQPIMAEQIMSDKIIFVWNFNVFHHHEQRYRGLDNFRFNPFPKPATGTYNKNNDNNDNNLLIFFIKEGSVLENDFWILTPPPLLSILYIYFLLLRVRLGRLRGEFGG